MSAPYPKSDLGPVLDEKVLEHLRDVASKSNPQLLHQLFEYFLVDVPADIESLLTFRTKQELKAVVLAAHSIKSSAANLGARHVQEIAGRIEQAASAGDSQNLNAEIAALQTAFAVALDQLRKFLKI